MRAVLLAFVAGCWLLQQQSALPAGRLLAAGGGIAAALSLVAWRMHGSRAAWVRIALCMAVAFLLGFAWAACRAEVRLARWIDPGLTGRDVEIDGIVAGLPDTAAHGTRFVFLVESWPATAIPEAARRRTAPQHLILTWQDPPAQLQPGQRYRMTVRLRRPRGLANPHGFDYAYWLLSQDIDATGYVSAGAALPATGATASGARPVPMAVRVTMLRARIRDDLRASLPENARFGPILLALVIGDQRGISPAHWDVFRRTGIAHLVSISGLHITMIAGLAGASARLLWRRSFGFGGRMRRPLPLLWPAQKAAQVAALLLALVYGAIAGMQIPALRTVTMLAVAAIALWGNRCPPASLVLIWAAALAIAIDPWAVMLPGFWLSFGAVAVIFLHAQGDADQQPARAGPPSALKRAGGRSVAAKAAAWLPESWRAALSGAARTQCAVTIGLVPLTLVLFGQVSVVSILANAVAIPVISLLVTPLALTGAVLPQAWSAVVLGVAHGVLVYLIDGLAWLARPSWAVWEAAQPGIIATVLSLCGIVLVLTPLPLAISKASNGSNASDHLAWWRQRARRLGLVAMPRKAVVRGAGVLAMIPILAGMRESVAKGEFRMTAIDVGQGTAVLVETRAHAMLYDAGPAYASGSSAGGQVIVPFLRASGVRQLDMLMISHEDADHAGGARDVLKAVSVAQGLTGAPRDHALLQGGDLEWQPCAEGRRWKWDGVAFEIIHPPEDALSQATVSSNGRSCVLRIATAHRSALLTGDISEREERALIRRKSPQDYRADILLAPHHGSGTSSHAAFLRAVRPEIAIFQLGFANRYQHPRADVWLRYKRADIARYRTDETGAVSVVTDKERYVVQAYRELHRRYWRDVPPMQR
ncbi:DNA internalization-related competence protein ComEC/Rec2 [Cupriavidus pauculus]|uniref:DNA internalization-related competence protein ComEC/Rec2 n=1 Tax=Cupriavidus pauculus TaxID=82633 RepID=UPI00078594C6|nr:DNA internalization-related competence protein ComEC/Rec2 [Cupriavidus pauculus]MBY4729637.1 DNA internalization-related competence protein ComEC/Rec2 [Cupriavidus pauculus]